ncbi:16S rRNA pseudouridine(516) synthase RsuA [Oceaniserpentilla sp. 4NH20-0058]|uniref:pseudouridine synthase n=1 Tax=Oceaniserpentilla sp. 4NH20-0058 TaxID=3127660 RepID=UPI0031073F62
MRLDKYLSDHTDLTRSLASKSIRQGRVSVNRIKAKSGAQKIHPLSDHIQLNGEAIAAQLANRYFMMNKPQGLVCANSDGDHPLVFDVMHAEHNLQKLHTVGRLDKDTTGLLLITDDGHWSHCITSPKHHQAKTYRARLAEPLIAEAEQLFSQGVTLKDDVKPTLPAQLERISEQEVLLTIHEGRYHQVKRMFAALGNRVETLHRHSIGSITLDSDLLPGHYRALSEQEVQALQVK